MNISHIKDCYGCGVCATICPKNIITLSLNKEGFYQPIIENLDECIDCGLCVDVCAFGHKELAINTSDEIECYAAWSNDSDIRQRCSSGGVGFEVGRALLNKGYRICGVRYNIEKKRAEHYLASSLEELYLSIGSKYIQSYTLDGFKSISKQEKNLVIGSPCQIDSFRRYLQRIHKEDNFILIDFFCHGVPSYWVWKKYLQEAETLIGKVDYVSWRNKLTGWHNGYSMLMHGEKLDKEQKKGRMQRKLICIDEKYYFNSMLTDGDSFYAFFLGNKCLGKACYKCRYKYNNSSADIRIGDMWGERYKKEDKGVSSVISFTERGKCILAESNCTLVPYPLSVVAEGQMKSSPEKTFIRELVIWLLKRPKISLQSILFITKVWNRLTKIYAKLIK